MTNTKIEILDGTQYVPGSFDVDEAGEERSSVLTAAVPEELVDVTLGVREPMDREVFEIGQAGEVGLELGLSYRTIEAHRARLLEKFGARKLPELVAKLSGMPL